ncbi:MAG: hypothetical protein JXA15_11910 [Spirochaetales bacterium]|nr:hypothetical protein [Spirochaetales bacterium]
MDNNEGARAPETAGSLIGHILQDLAFLALVWLVGAAGSAFAGVAGGLHPLLFLVLAGFMSWLVWHYIGRMAFEFEAYKRPDATRGEKAALKALEVFLVFYSLFFIGQGFFVFQIIEPLLAGAGLGFPWAPTAFKVASFLVPSLAALAGWLSRNRQPKPADLIDWVWPLVAALTLPVLFTARSPLEALGLVEADGDGRSAAALGIAARVVVALGIPLLVRIAVRALARAKGPAAGRFLGVWDRHAYPLLVSLTLYLWLRAILDLYVPASMANDINFRPQVAMLGLALFGPLPLRLILAVRPPFKTLGALVSIALVLWLGWDAYALTQARFREWRAAPLDASRLEALDANGRRDDFDGSADGFWRIYDASSETFLDEAPELVDGTLALRGEDGKFLIGPWLPIPADGTIRVERRARIQDLDADHYGELELYVGANERTRPRFDGLDPALVLRHDPFSAALAGAKGFAYVWVEATETEAALVSRSLPLGAWVIESLEWTPSSGKGRYTLNGASASFSAVPVEGSVYAAGLRGLGSYSRRSWIDWIEFGR